MAEESDRERTEPASQRRLEQARELGDVPRSPALSAFAVVLAAGGGLVLMGSALIDTLAGVMRAGLTLDREAAFDSAQLAERLYRGAASAVIGLSPWLLLVAAASLAAPMLLGGWMLSARPLAPDLSRLNPLRGLARLLSLQGLIDFARALVGVVVVIGVAAGTLWVKRAELATLMSEPLRSGLRHLAHLLGVAFFTLAGAMALLALLDVALQLWGRGRRLRMTRDEVRAELREGEVDPQVRAQMQALHGAGARRRAPDAAPPEFESGGPPVTGT
jgi:flagellar biosynthesis protein FlhB